MILLDIAVVVFPELLAILAASFLIAVDSILLLLAWHIRRVSLGYETFRQQDPGSESQRWVSALLSRGATCLQRSRCHNSMHHHKPILRQHCAICSSAFNKVVLKERSRSSPLRGPERKLFWSKSGIVRGFSALKARQHYVSARRQCVSACSSTSFRQCAEPTTIRAFTGASGADRHRPAGTERRGRSGQSGRHRSKHGSTLRLG